MITLIIALVVTVAVQFAAIAYISHVRHNTHEAWRAAEAACDVLRAGIIEKREELTYATQRYLDENRRCAMARGILVSPDGIDDPVGSAVDLLDGDDDEENDPVFRGMGALLGRIYDEVARAQGLFPQPNMLHAAFAEEAGEVANALLECERGTQTRSDFETECVQAAAMACRLYLEGDPSFPATYRGGES